MTIVWRLSMLPLFKVHKPERIGYILEGVFDSGFLTEGDYSINLSAHCEWIGNPNVCLTNSCTSALDLARHMCDVGQGMEVITTAMTCMATNLPFYRWPNWYSLIFSRIPATLLIRGN